MTTTPPNPQHPPRPQPPTPESIADRAAFASLVDNSLDHAQSTAEKWRTGLASLVTIATTALILKGPEQSSDLSTGWRIPITALLAAGLVVAIVGLWLALSAAAGTPATKTYESITRDYGSVKAYQVAEASASARLLRHARSTVVASLALFIAGMVTWWWAPAPPTGSSPVSVTTKTGTTCGTLTSGDGGTLHVAVAGADAPVPIPLSQVTNLRVVASCDK